MGLAASQARYLALTARRSDLEYQSQTINSRRIQLSYKTAEIAREYSDGMNNTRIKLAKTQVGDSGKTTNTWEELTFKNLLSSGYMLIGSEGTALDPAPYTEENAVTVKYTYSTPDKFDDTYDATSNPYPLTLTKANYDKLSNDMKNFYEGVGSKDSSGNYTSYKVKTYVDTSDAKYATMKAKLDEWKSGTDTKLKEFAEKFSSGEKVNYNYKVNSNYNGADIQSLLVSGKAQIVTKEFFDYLVSHGNYKYGVGLVGDKDFYTLLQQFEAEQEKNSTGIQSVVDWRSDETDTFESRTYSEDDEKVLAKYEADTAKIQALDKQLEMEEKNIETQHKAIETELENLKKVIQKNIEDTFKIFS